MPGPRPCLIYDLFLDKMMDQIFIIKIWLRVVILLNICPLCFESCSNLELRLGMEVLILLEVMWQGIFFLSGSVRNLVLSWALESRWVFFWTASILPVELLQLLIHLKVLRLRNTTLGCWLTSGSMPEVWVSYVLVIIDLSSQAWQCSEQLHRMWQD